MDVIPLLVFCSLVLAGIGVLLFVGSTPASAQSDTQPQPPPSDQPAPPSGPGITARVADSSLPGTC